MLPVQIATMQTFDLHPIFDLLQNLLSLEDSWQNTRFNALLKGNNLTPSIAIIITLQLHRIEMLQNRAARFVLNRPWRRHYHDSVSSMISTLNWQPLQTRRINAQLMLLFKIFHDYQTIASPIFTHPDTPEQLLDLTTIRNCSTINQELMYINFPSSPIQSLNGMI